MTKAKPDPAAARWLKQQRHSLEKVALAPVAQSLGRVTRVADGIAHISGLPGTRLNELLRFEGGETGLVLTLDEDDIGVVLLDESEGISAGARNRDG